MNDQSDNRRIEQYLAIKGRSIHSCLGAGTQGSVFLVRILSQSTEGFDRVAVKFHNEKVAYERELGVYLRLSDLNVIDVGGHMVPQLLGHDDDFRAIEMTIVSPPFCLDFGGAYLDQPPDYSNEVWDDWQKMKSESFGDNWPTVQAILAELQTYGIYVADVNPGNITFRSEHV